MENKHLMIGVIGCFIVTIGFAYLIYYEVQKSEKKDAEMRKMQAATKRITVDDNRDFSIYETLAGDDGREMILVPEGVFTRGSDEGDFDEKPQQEIYLDAFYVDKYEVSVQISNASSSLADGCHQDPSPSSPPVRGWGCK